MPDPIAPAPAPPPPPGSPPPPPPIVPPPNSGAVLFAGKYKSPEDLEQGFREIHKPLGLDEIPGDRKLVGQGGMYTDHSALESAYKTFEKLLSTRAVTSPPPPPPGEGLKIGGGEDANLDVPDLITKAGLKAEDLEKQWTEKNDLTDEQYAAIRKARPSLTKGDIKAIAEGMAAKAALAAQTQQAIRADAVQVAGGEKELNGLLAWAKTGFNAAEQADLNRRLGDPNLYKGALQQIAAAHRAALGAGNAQPLVGGTPASGSPVNTASDIFELTKRAEAGDTSAQAALKGIPMKRFAELMAQS